ncbi:CDP-alcohol phosphatidyltransferase family protein [Kineococcus sp. SYSU DK018]|uniref:CDP-alcohol phosphatidyltransferase family protein n=1 Tax=Kineococcus sp. SYSU DK018 TaxID=3383139 RepID=UPI003D7D6005
MPTQRAPQTRGPAVPDRAEYLRRWSRLHGGAAATGLVRAWLSGVHVLARPLALARVPPAAVTLAGTALAASAAWVALVAGPGGAPAVAVAVLVVAGGLLDNLDGAVAVLRERTSDRGALLDACCDRVGDAACALVLLGCGAPAWLAALAGGLAQLQEYLRARAQGLGARDVGVVSVAERPVRIAVAAACAAATAIAPGQAPWALLGAAAWALLGAVGLVQVAVALGRRL